MLLNIVRSQISTYDALDEANETLTKLPDSLTVITNRGVQNMFLINTQNKKAIPLEKKSFSELNLTERYDLQEWIADNPTILGENLLIIQKEFAGFSETNERLDLLALDENGKLVVIENKLDDSGKDVVWQALKYVSFCATLTKMRLLKFINAILRKKAMLRINYRSFMGRSMKAYA